MKLKYDLIEKEIDGTTFLVPVGEGSFSGMIRSNNTAAYIVELLKEEISQDGIVEKMCSRYDAPRETIARDVEKILDILKSINALDE